MDGIRGLHYNTHLNVLVSASEDATVKLWDTNKITSHKDVDVNNYHFEPYMTLRGNVDPILTMAGTSQNNNQCTEHLVLTGSIKGSIKAFRVVGPEKVDPYGS